MQVASFAPCSVKSARSFFPVRRLSSLPIWRLVSVISASVLRSRWFRVSTSPRSGFRLASTAWSSSSRCCAVRFSASRVQDGMIPREAGPQFRGFFNPGATSSFRLLAWPSSQAWSWPLRRLCLWLQPQSVLADPAEQLSDEQFLPLAPFKREEFPVRAWQEKMLEGRNGGTGTFANELLIRSFCRW